MGAVVGQHGVDGVGHSLDEGAEEVACDALRGFLVQFDEGELGGSVDGDQQVKLSLGGVDLGDVAEIRRICRRDVEIAERVGLELAFGGDGALDLGQPGDAVALEAAVQGRAGQMRQGGLQGIQAVVERQQDMPAESGDDGFVLDG